MISKPNKNVNTFVERLIKNQAKKINIYEQKISREGVGWPLFTSNEAKLKKKRKNKQITHF
jgi:hypothetical protein